MNTPTLDDLDAASEATWPAAREWVQGPFILRQGNGGGQRVSAATGEMPVSNQDIQAADQAMDTMDQRPIFRVRPGEVEIDGQLARAGYAAHDPVDILVARTDSVATLELRNVRSFLIWPPLAVMEELWDDGGIGAERRAVMARAKGAKTAVLGRGDDKPAGVAFAGVHNDIAMIHAVHVSPQVRRRKVAKYMMVALARWAQNLGVSYLATLCTVENQKAQNLYANLGFTSAGTYHYRVRKTQ